MTLAQIGNGAIFVFMANPKVAFLRMHGEEDTGQFACRPLADVPELFHWFDGDEAVALMDFTCPETREHVIGCRQCCAELVSVPMPAWNRVKGNPETYAEEAEHFRCDVCKQGAM